MRIRVLACAAFALLLLAFPAMAAAPAGEAVLVKPAATSQIEGAVATMSSGDDIFMGQQVVTGAKGNVQIVFHDDTHLVVGPGSTLVISEYLVRNDQSASKFVIDALGGTFRFVTGNSPKSAYEIKTPTGTIGVRGTVFDFEVDPETGETWVVLFHGAVKMCASGAGCTTMKQTCGLGRIPERQRAEVLPSSDKRQIGVRSNFPYITKQTPLRRDFRVANSEKCKVPPKAEVIEVEAEKPVCPVNTEGTYPDCTPIECPVNTEGTYPDCEPIQCPEYTTGTYPDCDPIECPEYTTGTYPDCDPIECPEYTTGTYPDCDPIECPEYTTGTYPTAIRSSALSTRRAHTQIATRSSARNIQRGPTPIANRSCAPRTPPALIPVVSRSCVPPGRPGHIRAVSPKNAHRVRSERLPIAKSRHPKSAHRSRSERRPIARTRHPRSVPLARSERPLIARTLRPRPAHLVRSERLPIATARRATTTMMTTITIMDTAMGMAVTGAGTATAMAADPEVVASAVARGRG